MRTKLCASRSLHNFRSGKARPVSLLECGSDLVEESPEPPFVSILAELFANSSAIRERKIR